eukprot:932682-Amphidinium_carterae.1
MCLPDVVTYLESLGRMLLWCSRVELSKAFGMAFAGQHASCLESRHMWTYCRQHWTYRWSTLCCAVDFSQSVTKSILWGASHTVLMS